MTVSFSMTVKGGLWQHTDMSYPGGRPALSAGADRACSPGPFGDDQEHLKAEREFLMDALCPAHSALLRARHPWANPQALLPLSLPDARWRTDRARRTSVGFAPLHGFRFFWIAGRSLAGTPKALPSRSRNRQ